MDFITQNLLGAVAGHAACGRSRRDGGTLGRLALAAGALGGAVPDFDFLLQPLADPAMPWQLHRHFTHAFVFIPVGGVLATLPFLAFRSGRRRFGVILAAATIGCATHGLLDNLTSYGTHVLWPFRSDRTVWDAMSIVDPIFTLVLLLGVLIATLRDRVRPTRVAAAVAAAYIAMGFVQHGRALEAQQTLAAERGHAVVRGRTLPTVGNWIVFRSIYEADGRLWADAVRVAPFGDLAVREGRSMPRFTEEMLASEVAITERTRVVLRGLDAFADGFVGRVTGPDAAPDGVTVGDMRITGMTDGFRPLWGVRFDRDGAPHAWDAFGRGGDDEETMRAVLGGMLADVVRPEGRFRVLASPSPGD
ncbi:MAG: metal-dependent hydrolase [Phycisphaerales bacterium]|nr:metal-dependent hydrolase [Phycisphaerales bacterium]